MYRDSAGKLSAGGKIIATWRNRIGGYISLMKNRLMIDLGNLPEEGKEFSGELAKEIFDLSEGDAQAAGPLNYELWGQRFGQEFLLTGSLIVPFEFTCVRTLHPFVQTIRLENAAISVEIEKEGEIDVTEALREEVLINFPIDPRCEEGDLPQKCEIDSRYLSVDKSPQDGLPTPPAPRVTTDGLLSTLSRTSRTQTKRTQDYGRTKAPPIQKPSKNAPWRHSLACTDLQELP